MRLCKAAGAVCHVLLILLRSRYDHSAGSQSALMEHVLDAFAFETCAFEAVKALRQDKLKIGNRPMHEEVLAGC